jgi:flavoprotein
MKLAPCPNCGLPTDAKYGQLETVEWAIVGWRCMCIRCGYSGPACNDQADAVRRHNKISQNCGACQT